MEDKKKIESIEYDDDNEGYAEFDKYMTDDTQRKKLKTAKIIDQHAEILLAEIELKKENQNVLKKDYMKYILKHCDGKYNKKMLEMYSFDDVKSIYFELKNNRNFFIKIFDFFFGS